jgi:hypothetical protein
MEKSKSPNQKHGEPVYEETMEQPSVVDTAEHEMTAVISVGKRGHGSRRCIRGEEVSESERERTCF